MPATPPLQARRGSMRTRIAVATNLASNSASTTSKTGTAAQTRAQQHVQQDTVHGNGHNSTGSSASASTPPSTTGRPGRPRKEPLAPAPPEDSDRRKKSRGRPPRIQEPTTEPSTPPASELSSTEVEARFPSPPTSTVVEMQMDVDGVEKEESYLQSQSQPLTRKTNNQRHSTRQSTSSLRGGEGGSRNSSGNSSSRSSEAPEHSQNHSESHPASEDRESEDASSDSDEENEEDDPESDEDHQQVESSKGKQQKTTAPSKRRLRSSKLVPSVVARLAADSNGLTIDQIMEEYTEEQQLLRANASAADALARLFRQGIQDSESLHPDMVDAQDYELIRHTFGEIEDLNLNLTGTLTTLDDSSDDDDELTKSLKRKHRKAKRNLKTVSLEYMEVRRSMTIKMSAQLDKEEAQIKAGTHPDLLAELKAIENRRQARIRVVQAQRTYFQRMWDISFQAACKAADDQYRAGQITARKNIIDMVQNRMNRIRQELAQSNRQAGVTIPRRLIYVKAVEAAGEYDSCGDDCSSYDSYSSSGSECSDCEVCRPPRCLEIPQLKGPKGLGRREVAVDLAFLFPPSDHSRDGHQASHDGEMDREVPTNVRQYNSEGEDPFLPSSYRNQQYMIDHLNEERRRKRRVLDREMQSKVAYKKHLGNTRGDGGPSQDMDVDQNQDLIPMDRESTSQSAIELSSRPQSPDLTGSPQHARSSKRAKNFQPRFLPGFGPDGLKAVKRPVEPLPVPAPTPRYPMPDRYARTWDSNYYNNAEYFGTAEDDTRSYPSVEKGLSGQHRGRPSRETNWGNLSQVYVQQHLRQQELEDAAYRSKNTHSQSQARPSPMALTTPRQPAPEDVYPFDSERRFKFKQVFPQKQFMSPSPRPSRPPPPEPVRHQNPRGRPSKNSRAIPWAGPLDHQGHTHTGNQSPHRHPSVSPRATQASVGGSSKIMPSMRRYEAPGMSVDAEPEQHRHAAGFKRTPHARADITPYDQFVPMYSSSAPSTPSMPPPARSSSTSTTPQHQGHPYSAEQSPMLAYQQFQRQQQRSISHHRPGPGGIREFAGPIITDLTSPSNSPKQSFTGVPSPDLTVASVSTNTVNGDHQNGFTGAGMGQTLPRQSMSMSPIQKAPKSHPGVRG